MKEPLTIAHLADGEVLAELNRKIQDASAALDATDNPKAVAKISLDIKISAEGDNFRKVATAIKLTAPAPAAKAEILAVNTIDSQRVITVDPDLKDDQLPLPGVADINRKRAAQA